MSGDSVETADTYFGELAVLLSEAGMPADRVGATLDELAGYLAESGDDPEEEFGPASELARELTVASAPPAEPAANAHTWHWTADLFQDVKMLNEYGAQGWEVDRVDVKGLFISVRDPEHPQQWEYRRELIAPGRREACSTGSPPMAGSRAAGGCASNTSSAPKPPAWGPPRS
ncbi:hypothetical protein ACFQX6_38260 [Streptosporangium lutulentum]